MKGEKIKGEWLVNFVVIPPYFGGMLETFV